MKKWIAMLLCMVMLMPFGALAGGLPSIGGGLPNIGASGDAGVLPDPGDLLGQKGTVFARDYAYGGMLCTVYLYAMPASPEAFMADYAAKAQANGFAAQQTALEGFAALSLSYGGQQALLFPQYSGQMMLMVQNGMAFGKALPTGTYVQFTRNGRTITSVGEVEGQKRTRSIGTSRMFEVNYFFREEPISLFTLAFPDHAQTGDVFHVTRESLMDGLYFYTTEEGSLVFYDSPYHHRMETLADYFTVEITSLEKTQTHVYIEGVFEGQFDGGDTVYEDGSFRVEVVR